LLALIREHEAIQIAVAACAHKMSPQTLRAFIGDRLKTVGGVQTRGLGIGLGPTQIRFLEAIVLAHHVNPLTFPESDSQLAQTLLRCSASDSNCTSQKLETVVKLLIVGIPSHSFVSSFVRSMLHGYCAKLSAEIQALERSSSWLKAHGETEWLSMLLFGPLDASPEEKETVEILCKRFPDWKMWAEWNESDSQLVQALDACRQVVVDGSQSVGRLSFPVPPTISSTSQLLERLVKAQIARSRRKLPNLCQDARKVMAIISAQLTSEVQSLKMSHQWLMAHEKTEWLLLLLDPSLQSSPESREVIEQLAAQFPDWRAWAEWNVSDSQLAEAVEACLKLEVFLDASKPIPLTISSTSRLLERLIKAQIAGSPRKLPNLCQDARILTQIISTQLAGQVHTLSNSHQWLTAHKETEWFSALLDPSLQSPTEASEVIGLLAAEFPDWRAWAEWSDSDSRLVHALIPCFTDDGGTASQKLKIVVKLLVDSALGHSLLDSEVRNLACAFSVDLSNQLQVLEAEGRWREARRESAWLSLLLGQPVKPGQAEAIRILEHRLMRWRAWALWRPDMHRLFMQKRLSSTQRGSLRDLLALEGPDFRGTGQSTLREALIAQYSNFPLLQVCWGKIRLNVQTEKGTIVRDMLERLSNVVNAACTSAKAPEIDLLTHLCCSGQPINNYELNVLGANGLIGDSLVMADVLLVLRPQKGEQGRSSQMAATMRLLTALAQPNGHALREVLSLQLVNLVSSFMREMQAMLSIQLDDSKRVTQLYAFGMVVRAAQWFLPSIDDSMDTLISGWPSIDTFWAMETLQADIRSFPTKRFPRLKQRLNQYHKERFIKPGTLDVNIRNLVEVLIQLWHQKTDPYRKLIAMTMGQDSKTGSPIYCECLRQLPTVSDAFVYTEHQILQKYAKRPNASCIKEIHLFATTVLLDKERSSCWRSLITYRIKRRGSIFFKHALTHLTVEEWFQLLSDLQVVMTDMVAEDSQTSPKLFQPTLHEWTRRIRTYRATIERLESDIGSGTATQSLLVGFESDCSESIVQILELLEHDYQHLDNDEEGLQQEVRETIALLDLADGGNAKEIYLALSMLTHTRLVGSAAYLRVLEVYQQASKQVAHVLLVGWLRHPDLTILDKWALEALGKVLGIHLNDDDHPVMNSLDAAGGYITKQTASLFAEVGRLAGLRRSLRAKDPEGYSALVAELGIEDTSTLEDEISSLPLELVDVIEVVGENVVELHFPLTHLTELQRAGMGIRNSQSLIVRLLVTNSSLPSGFCLHFDDDPKGLVSCSSHSPWLAFDGSGAKGVSSCFGHVNRATFQLGFILQRHLLHGPESLEKTYEFLKLRIDTLSQYCIVCGKSLGIRLRRSAACQNYTCFSTFLKANLSIQLYDLRADTQVADLLFTATQAAATSGNIDLLPSCPFLDVASVTELLGTVANRAISTSLDLDDTIRSLGKKYVVLLNWIFGHYGGFIVSASGKMRIPSMPGAHQFLLASAAPGLESAFTKQMLLLPTKVVFHGTSLDRLYAILCQGLRNCSGNSLLQRHGAAHGKGIYVADEPTTALQYAHTYNAPLTVYRSTNLNNVSVLLGLEASGKIPTAVSGGIRVIVNPSMLILRYIFLIPTGVSGPLARHIVPAMTSVFASLRSGSL
jgi:hypothetical protein